MLRVSIGHAGELIGPRRCWPCRVRDRVEQRRSRRGEGAINPAVLSRAELLTAITALRRCAAVSGTHGKTTTTSMLTLMLLEANRAPSFLIGGDVNEIGASAAWGSGEWLVVEADESDGTFLHLGAELAVVTNVDPDHLDYYGSMDAFREAFRRFCSERHASRWSAPTMSKRRASLRRTH